MRFNYFDADSITIQADNETNAYGYNQDVWDVYMLAMVETWSGFEVQRVNETGNDLTINTERYSMYYVPFRLRFPQKIELDQGADNTMYAGGSIEAYPNIVGAQISLGATLVVLYAVIEQRSIEINFNPANGEAFGTATLKLKTQTVYPFGLRDHNTSPGGAVIRFVSGDLANVDFTASQNSQTCNGTVVPDGLCEQEWDISITPNQCDISGQFEAEFFAECFDTTYGCGLDSEIGQTNSNAYSGVLRFSVQAQSFCPSVLDEISVSGSIAKFVDSDFTDTANPGTNLFVNDHVYYEVSYTTSSAKLIDTGSTLDDTIISFARARKILMTVAMVEQPLQHTIDQTSSDVVYTDELNYAVTLCEVSAFTFPYMDALDSTNDCFSNLGHNAQTYMNFGEYNATTSSDAIQAAEIGFGFRLDERVIPVDLPNSNALITIDVWAEIYYKGVTNPVRRKLSTEMRRNLQSRSRTEQATVITRDQYDIGARSEMSFCTLDIDAQEFIGFAIDVEMRQDDLPLQDSRTHMMDMEHHLARYLRTPTAQVSIYRAEACPSTGQCREFFPVNVASSGNERYRSVRYFVDLPARLSLEFQTDLYYHNEVLFSECQFLAGKLVRTYSVDQCDESIVPVFMENRHALDVDQVVSMQSNAKTISALICVFLTFLLRL